jgi:uncharacterized Rmd1/YagE family protein
LEIKPRIQVLNERCRVFLDLAEILSDAIADTKMTRKSSLHDNSWELVLIPISLTRYHLDHNHTYHHLNLCDLL